MTNSYHETLDAARKAINAGKKNQAMNLLKSAVEEKPKDPAPGC